MGFCFQNKINVLKSSSFEPLWVKLDVKLLILRSACSCCWPSAAMPWCVGSPWSWETCWAGSTTWELTWVSSSGLASVISTIGPSWTRTQCCCLGFQASFWGITSAFSVLGKCCLNYFEGEFKHLLLLLFTSRIFVLYWICGPRWELSPCQSWTCPWGW